MKKLYALDNAASIFPSIIDKRTTVVFRISFTLTEKVQKDVLQRALDRTIRNFPYFKLKLTKKITNYYLEEIEGNPAIDASDESPCRIFTEERDSSFLFRVRIFMNSIALEMSHLLTDGTGALTFLNDLTRKYFMLLGGAGDKKMPLPTEKSLAAEDIICPYKAHYKKDSPAPPFCKKAFRIPGKLIAPEQYRIDRRSVSLKAVKEKARELGVSITEYTAALYLYALQKIYYKSIPEERNSSVIRVEIPVNLRALYQTETLRNFTLFVLPELDMEKGPYSFQDIVNQTSRIIRQQAQTEEMTKMLSRNVRGEKLFIVRIMPRILRDAILKIAYSRLGESQFSGLLTNLGKVDLSPEIADKISEVDFIAAPSGVLKTQCGMVSWNDRLIFNFGSLIENDDFDRVFYSVLEEEGHVPEKMSSLW